MIGDTIKGLLGLKAPVGDGRPSHSEDVKTVQRGMTALGRYAEHDEPNGILDKPLHDAVTGISATAASRPTAG